MKLPICLSRIVMLSVIFTTPVFAGEEVVDGIAWHYEVFQGGASVGGFTSSLSAPQGRALEKCHIPSTLGGCPVTGIAKRAFANRAFSSIAIPNTVTSIGESAFAECYELTSITIPDGVTSIGTRAFQDCRRLTSIRLPSTVKNVESMAFADCFRLSSIDVDPGNIAYVSKDGVLLSKDASSLVAFPAGRAGSYAVPETVTKIEKGAFCGAMRLTSISLPAGIMEIGPWAFLRCKGLQSIIIPNGVTRLEKGTFSRSSLFSISIPDSVTYIGAFVFAECPMQELFIPNSVKTIDDEAFHGCDKVKTLSLPRRFWGEESRLMLRYCLSSDYKVIIREWGQ